MNEQIYCVVIFLRDKMDIDEEEAFDVVADIQRAIRNDCRMQDVFDILNKNEINLKNDISGEYR